MSISKNNYYYIYDALNVKKINSFKNIEKNHDFNLFRLMKYCFNQTVKIGVWVCVYLSNYFINSVSLSFDYMYMWFEEEKILGNFN